MSYIEKHMTESLKDHELTMIADTPDIKAFYMKRPGTGIFSVLLVFSPEGIGLTGDLILGLWSVRNGYGLDWFSGDLSEDYLCSKFLMSNHWDADRAASAHIFEDEPDDIESLTRAKEEMRTHLKDGDIDNPHYLATEMEFHLFDTSCEFPGYGYNLAVAGWLCAVQQRFRELYAKEATQ